VTVTDDGCSNTDAVQVKVNPLPTVSITATPASICINSVYDVSFTTIPSSGGDISGFSGDHFDPPTEGSGIHPVTYTYTDANGCSNGAEVNVKVLAPPTLSDLGRYGSTVIAYGNFPDQVQMTISGGGGVTTYHPTSQSGGQAIFYEVDLRIGDLVTIQAVDDNDCFAYVVYTGIEELPFGVGEEASRDNRIFDMQGQIVNKNKSELAPGIYIQGGRKFMVMGERNF
jgi:hypothetical protein